MKWIITLLLFAPALALGQYHIRVECYGHQKIEAYYVRFTNDNWTTIYPIMDSFDNAVEGLVYPVKDDVHFQERLFIGDGSKSEAVRFAERFISFYQCCKYNEYQKQQYAKLYRYRVRHPMHQKVENPLKQRCCTIVQVH